MSKHACLDKYFMTKWRCVEDEDNEGSISNFTNSNELAGDEASLLSDSASAFAEIDSDNDRAGKLCK